MASRTKGGELVINDKSKELLLNLLINKLSDASFIRSSDFRTVFFRNVEIWRLNSHFIDITYYFCFSGIEALARCKFNDYDSPAAQVITPFLTSLGFEITQDDMQNYAHVRNTLFHYGHHSKIINKNGSSVELKLSDFEDNIMRLFPDILLKIIGFDDAHVNWNRWKDFEYYYWYFWCSRCCLGFCKGKNLIFRNLKWLRQLRLVNYWMRSITYHLMSRNF